MNVINKISDQDALLNEIAELRRQYYTDITVRNPSQIVFLKGWLNRVDDCLNVRI
ncbi:putative peptidoglycan-binding domain-containing protein [Paraburkholderia sp. CI3]|uniref:putative peptidoglycan-binding domain-containing protein n=1 Tax=Paraburkholderia sp. CI3 TaxID=2991060 RepID=UPI003D224BB8